MQTVASIVRSIQELMEELQIPPSTPLDNRVLGSLAIPSAEGIPILQTTEVKHDEMRRIKLNYRVYLQFFIARCFVESIAHRQNANVSCP